MAIVGAGGFGRETYDLIRSCDPHSARWDIAGFVDAMADSSHLSAIGSQWLGNDQDFLSGGRADSVLLAVGDPHLRARLATRYRDAGVSIANFIHPSADVGSNTTVGEGCIVSAGAMVMNSSRLGAFTNIDRRAMVGHDSRIDDFGTLHPADDRTPAMDLDIDPRENLSDALNSSDFIVWGSLVVGDAHAFLTRPLERASDLNFGTTEEGFLSSLRRLDQAAALIPKAANDFFRLNSTLCSWRNVTSIEYAS